MPITLGCPSCGKRFRAREESSGKKVKCPFCQAAVPVPNSDESPGNGGPADGPSPSGVMGTLTFGNPNAPSGPVPAASPDAWGAADPVKPPTPMEDPIPFAPIPGPSRVRPLPPPPPGKPARSAKGTKSPEEQAVAAWKKARGGLFWVHFALFWFAVLAVIPVGKIVYERAVGPLPKGEGADWVKYDDVINAPGENAVQLSKEEMVDLLAYGVPVLLGGLALAFGRVTAGAAPRSSGAKGLFAFSGLIALLALAGYITSVVCERVAYREIGGYGLWTARLGAVLGEFWFLLALAAAGATLRRPASVRTVGLFSLMAGLGVAIYFVGWDVYLQKIGPEIGRPKKLEAGSDWLFYEAAATLLGWLILIGTYWRAVGGVRAAIKEHVRD